MGRLYIICGLLAAFIALSYGADKCENESWDLTCWRKKKFTQKDMCYKAEGKQKCAETCNLCNEKCGISKVSQSRIVNGVEAKEGAWPWIASLQLQGKHFCGATILTPKWVLAASHCVQPLKNMPNAMDAFTVTLGAHDITKSEPKQQTIKVKRFIIHKDYDTRVMMADIALLELETPAMFNDRVVTPCLPNEGSYPPKDLKCVVAGWGITKFPSSNTASKLQQTILPVVGTPHQGCHNNKEVVCVGNGFTKTSEGKQQPNACQGDSGGPLVCQLPSGQWRLEGVASYVHTYCKYYTAYAPVNKYMPWIKQYVPGL
ncbi:chymotrypsinogen B-like [Clytia hemisphaerica]|uniref:Peptidase S1 domain-containing protein n=1 Tax=Clytia hemisphaerica TaxID=252671 RepID=A0A7M5UYA8_9CNID